MPSTGTAFSCSAAQLASVAQLLGDQTRAEQVCSRFDVGSSGAQTAVLQYLAQSSSTSILETNSSLNTAFILFSGYLVFVMQCGFAMLCAGHIRVKNSMNILLKNLLDCSIGTLTWYLLGNGFAFGENTSGMSNPFIGSGDFALSQTKANTTDDSSWHMFFFHWAFSAAAATIVAGAVAERVAFECYMGYTCLMTGFVYPVIVHWIWTKWGWLSPFNATPLFGSGVIDFAGGVAVHTVGGTAALIGAYFCGPRIGRFGVDGEVNREYRETNGNLVVLGTFLLWFGWYGFNPGSAVVIAGSTSAATVSRTAVTTTLAAGTGGIASMFMSYAVYRNWDVMQLCNGVLCGLVAVTPGCGVLSPWAGVVVAILAAGLFLGLDHLLLKLLIDDVVAAVPMHLGCGVLGTLFVGLFANEEYVVDFYGVSPAGMGFAEVPLPCTSRHDKTHLLQQTSRSMNMSRLLQCPLAIQDVCSL
eukprot:GHUV01027097.1.p1 GENE.GHUV01027097.1~~GHUV01027097.1.p1  ORF type:complete len:471 (+),score=64.51 GHUV01027097.1:207-1619(+)